MITLHSLLAGFKVLYQWIPKGLGISEALLSNLWVESLLPHTYSHTQRHFPSAHFHWLRFQNLCYCVCVCVCVCVSAYYSMPCWATQDGHVIVESSDKTWPTGEGNGTPLQCSCPENPISSMKRQKDMTLKDELSRSVGAQYTFGEGWRNNSRKNEETEPKQKQHPVVVMEVMSNAVKSNIT